jgi:hypothetical protein
MSTLAVVLSGSLLHFAWEWSGRHFWVGIVAATNESTWEHLKLAFWPALVFAPIQRWIYGAYPGWLPATAIRCVFPSVLITTLFYGYTALLVAHHLVADILVFVMAVFLGELLGHSMLPRESGRRIRSASALVVVVAAIAFSTLTYSPPDSFLFRLPGQ